MSNKIPGQIGHVGRIFALAQQEGSIDVERAVNTLTGINAKQAHAAIDQLMKTGKLHRARTGYHDSRYFVDPAVRDAYLAQVGEYVPPAQRSHRAISRVSLDRNAPVVVPANVKVTICPSWTHDPRIQFDPAITRLPPNLKGAGFVQEWNRKRRSRVTARSQA